MSVRIRYFIEGIVQGVGFRPTVYKIATSLNLKGFVLNSSNGVLIEVEGERAEEFLDYLKNNLPPLAKIDSIKKEKLPLKNYQNFIIKSSVDSEKSVFISPDIAVCDDCLKEMYDKNNRRFFYPFINCTNCGPRYSIIENIPYDRKNTSMKKFKMCEDCYKEYNNPLDRRYHAQPISCFNCGPKLIVRSKENNFKEIPFFSEKEKIEFIANKIKEGNIVAIKGLGGFHFVCNALDKEAVSKLRDRKNRKFKPFALMFKDINQVKNFCDISAKEEEIILSKEKPIVLVKKRVDIPLIADGIDRYGVFLPYTPLHYLLFEFLDFPLVATSANISDEPIVKDFREIKRIENIIDFMLDNDREIINAVDDSIVQVIDNEVMIMRNARGFAPFSIKKNIKPNLLGVGANQKNSIAISLKGKVILSPHIGDLNTLESVEFFERTIDTLRRIYNFEEDIIVCDKHPLYESTKWALSQNKEVIQIQHHYAHALATMFEYNLDGDYLVFAFDGTGYGDDGTIWGGEVFIANRKSYKRVHYIKPFSLIGGEKGIKNPANFAVSLIDEDLAKNFSNYKIVKALKNAPFIKTSSMGRVFDAVAFLGGLIDKNYYEGFSGLRIEKFYSSKEFIDIKIEKKICLKEIFNFAARNRGNFERVSSVFINSIVNMMVKIIDLYNLPVIVTGGVFQNKTLLRELLKRKRVYFSKKIPLNDGGISIGQIFFV